jgi:hypothetical protein
MKRAVMTRQEVADARDKVVERGRAGKRAKLSKFEEYVNVATQKIKGEFDDAFSAAATNAIENRDAFPVLFVLPPTEFDLGDFGWHMGDPSFTVHRDGNGIYLKMHFVIPRL